MLSAAKHLACHTELLRCAQHDTVPMLVVHVHQAQPARCAGNTRFYNCCPGKLMGCLTLCSVMVAEWYSMAAETMHHLYNYLDREYSALAGMLPAAGAHLAVRLRIRCHFRAQPGLVCGVSDKILRPQDKVRRGHLAQFRMYEHPARNMLSQYITGYRHYWSS